MQTFKNPDGNDERKTLVDEGTELKGTLKSTCAVVIRGKVEGEVTAPAIDVSATGAVHGRLKAGTLTSAGELSGELDAESVRLSGTVRDKTAIRAKSLEVSLGAAGPKFETSFGECVLEIGVIPNKETVVAASMNAGVRSESTPKTDAVNGAGQDGQPAGQQASGEPLAAPAVAAVEAASASATDDAHARATGDATHDDPEPTSLKETATAASDPGAAIMSALSDASADSELDPSPPMLARSSDGASRKVAPKYRAP